MKTEKNIHWEKKQDILTTVKIDISAQTDIGLKRKTNQDRYAMSRLSDNTILIALADGLGGDPGGETASDYVIGQLTRVTDLSGRKINEGMVSLFKKLDQDITAMAENNDHLDGMATTLILLLIKDNTAYWCHSGDSRLYHLRKDLIYQITRDQTLARFLIEEGEITREQAKNHYSLQVIDQYIGCQDLTPETGQIQLKSDDRLILVSDGLYRPVSLNTIYGVCSKIDTPSRATTALVNSAIRSGGEDNITVVIGKIR